jgi:hypothetical protein
MKNKRNIYSPPTSVVADVHSQKERGETRFAKTTKSRIWLLVFAIIVTVLNVLVAILKARAGESGLSWDTFYRFSRISVVFPFIFAAIVQRLSSEPFEKNIFFYVYLCLSTFFLIVGLISPFINLLNMKG